MNLSPNSITETMTSILSTPGKYRSRKDLSTGSIPTLVSLEEESSLHTVTGAESELSHSYHIHPLASPNGATGSGSNGSYEPFSNALNIKNGLSAKSPRRSSLAIGLLGGRNNGNGEKGNKRRSSIAVAFLGGRRDSKSHNHNYPIATIPEKYHKTTESDIENDSPNHYYTVPAGSVAAVLGGDPNGQSEYGGGSNGNLTVNGSGYDKKRRRSSSWQTKLERRRRKGMSSALDNAEGSGNGLDSFGSANGLDAFTSKYGREKRHSWWNIFVPENLKQR